VERIFITMKHLFENWRRFINELLVHGPARPEKGSYIIAHRENLWVIDDDDLTEEQAEHISHHLNLETEIYTVSDVREELEDSERSEVLLGTVHNNVLHIERIGAFQIDPQSSIVAKKVVKQLGLSGAEYPRDIDYHDTTLVSKYSMEGKIPKIAYHGTSIDLLEQILKFGLMPNEKTNYVDIEHPELVFFSTRIGEALGHALHTSDIRKSDPIILEIKIPNKNLIVPDYDVSVKALDDDCYDYICSQLRTRQKEFSKIEGSATALSREFGIYGYKGRIPAKFIQIVHILQNPEINGQDSTDISNYYKATQEEAKIYLRTLEDFGMGYFEEPDYDDDDDDDDSIPF